MADGQGQKSSLFFEEAMVLGTNTRVNPLGSDPYQDAIQLIRDAVTKQFSAQEINNSGPRVAEFVRTTARKVYLDWNESAATKGISRIPLMIDLFISKAESELLGMGALDPLLADQTIEDIAINGPKEAYVYRGGGWSQAELSFSDPNRLLEILNRGIANSNKQVNQVTPIVDANLPGRERISVVSFPVVIDHYPVAVVRAQRAKTITLNYFARANPRVVQLEAEMLRGVQESPIPEYTAENGPGAMLSASAASYLHAAVLAGLNIVVLGPTGVGKTTMLTALGRCLPAGMRMLIIEDTPEIKLHPESDVPMNVVYLRTRPPSMEGVPAVTQEDLVKLALRQRPDALTLGEARGAEIYDLLNALYTGHKNGLTSLHAESSNDMFNRIFLMLAQSERGRLVDAARAAQLVAKTLNIAVQLELRGRVRRVLSISELTGAVALEGGRPQPVMQEIYRHTGMGGSLQGPLTTSAFSSRFVEMGVPAKYFIPS